MVTYIPELFTQTETVNVDSTAMYTNCTATDNVRLEQLR